MLSACAQNSIAAEALLCVQLPPQPKGIKTTPLISLKKTVGKEGEQENLSSFHQKWISMQPRMQFVQPEEKKFGHVDCFASW